jgi:hypothetical protein
MSEKGRGWLNSVGRASSLTSEQPDNRSAFPVEGPYLSHNQSCEPSCFYLYGVENIGGD